jgi:hypothetical protein
MRCLYLSAFLLLGACASAPPATHPVAGPPVPATADRLPYGAAVVAALARAGQPDALTLDQAAALIGPPDLERRDGLGVFQTYRLDSCALLLAFAMDARGVQRLRRAEAGIRRAGDPPPDPQTCFAAVGGRQGQN